MGLRTVASASLGASQFQTYQPAAGSHFCGTAFLCNRGSNEITVQAFVSPIGTMERIVLAPAGMRGNSAQLLVELGSADLFAVGSDDFVVSLSYGLQGQEKKI